MRRLPPLLAALALLALTTMAPAPAAATSPGFAFNWPQAPAAPQPWVPGPVNDWDLVTNIDGPTDANGTMEASHGADCGAPPATHHVVSLVDSVFLCKNHMMTALYGGGDAFVTYGAIYFAPAQMADWSQGAATVSWKVSTQRLSTRDWWQVNLTPFAQNMALPLTDDLPAYQGQPETGLELRQDTGTCTQGQKGSILRVSTITNAQPKEITQESPCVEDAVSPSAATRSQFQIDVSPGHLKVYMPGTSVVWYDGPLSLGFNQAVVQFSHHSYNPLKGENPVGGPAAPNTFHWSDVAITPAAPFTMLRPEQPFSLHEGQDPVLKLPQAAPQGSYLRFAGLGNFEVSADGGKSWQPARVQGANRAPEHFASYWTPVPAGTTEVSIRGQRNASNLPWWVEDVSVWAQGSTAPAPAQQEPAPAIAPSAAPVEANPPAGQAAAKPSGDNGSPAASVKARAGARLYSIAHAVRARWQPWFLALAAVPIAAVGAAALVWRRRRRQGQP
jgi:hypothetical protein